MLMPTRRRPLLPARSAFAGFRFPAEVIVVAVRWYLRYNLSYRDVEDCWSSGASRSTTSACSGGCSGSCDTRSHVLSELVEEVRLMSKT